MLEKNKKYELAYSGIKGFVIFDPKIGDWVFADVDHSLMLGIEELRELIKYMEAA